MEALYDEDGVLIEETASEWVEPDFLPLQEYAQSVNRFHGYETNSDGKYSDTVAKNSADRLQMVSNLLPFDDADDLIHVDMLDAVLPALRAFCIYNKMTQSHVDRLAVLANRKFNAEYEANLDFYESKKDILCAAVTRWFMRYARNGEQLVCFDLAACVTAATGMVIVKSTVKHLNGGGEGSYLQACSIRKERIAKAKRAWHDVVDAKKKAKIEFELAWSIKVSAVKNIMRDAENVPVPSPTNYEKY